MWTVEQTATFLSFVATDRLAVMWWLIALRGLRRGEAAGLRWTDVDLDARAAMIEQQRIANGHLVTVGPPTIRARSYLRAEFARAGAPLIGCALLPRSARCRARRDGRELAARHQDDKAGRHAGIWRSPP